MAVFEFLTGTTGARIVAADFGVLAFYRLRAGLFGIGINRQRFVEIGVLVANIGKMILRLDCFDIGLTADLNR